MLSCATTRVYVYLCENEKHLPILASFKGKKAKPLYWSIELLKLTGFFSFGTNTGVRRYRLNGDSRGYTCSWQSLSLCPLFPKSSGRLYKFNVEKGHCDVLQPTYLTRSSWAALCTVAPFKVWMMQSSGAMCKNMFCKDSSGTFCESPL